MNFKLFHEENKNTKKSYTPTVYLDMDGVLCDFKSPITMALMKQSFTQVSNRDFNEFFEQTNVADYFARLPKFPEGQMLIDFVLGLFGSYCICSCPLKNYVKQSIHGKNEWIKKNLDKEKRPLTAHYVFDKSKYAVKEDGTPNILIDDQDNNINDWSAAGGIAIKFESDHGEFHGLVEKLTNELKKLDLEKKSKDK